MRLGLADGWARDSPFVKSTVPSAHPNDASGLLS